jgi:hypothetical protein
MIKNIAININNSCYKDTFKYLLSELYSRGYNLYAYSSMSVKELNRELQNLECKNYITTPSTNNIITIKDYYLDIINNTTLESVSELLIVDNEYNNIKIAQKLNLQICFSNDYNNLDILKCIKYYENPNIGISKKTLFQKSINIVIPIMGDNRRFLTSFYRMERNLIDMMDKPFYSWIVNNLQIDANYIFVIREHLCRIHKIDSVLKCMYPNCTIIQSEQKTQGNACSILLAEKYINNDNPLIIANDNQWLEWNVEELITDFLLREKALLQAISFNPYGNNMFHYIQSCNINNKVIKSVHLNKPISENAFTEIYFWRHGKDYIKYTHRMNSQNKRFIGEFCTTLVTNEVLDDINNNLIPKDSVIHVPCERYFIFNEAHCIEEFEKWFQSVLSIN